jgi:hypothetical protein
MISIIPITVILFHTNLLCVNEFYDIRKWCADPAINPLGCASTKIIPGMFPLRANISYISCIGGGDNYLELLLDAVALLLLTLIGN